MELGVICSSPSVEGTRYDCVLDVDGRLYRAQIEYCNCAASHAAEAVTVRLKSNTEQGAARCYTREDVDALLVHIPSLGRICLFPQEIFCGKTALGIRLEHARNGQSKGCVYAKGFLW